MKLLVIALSLLGLSLLQEALCTHLETCECHEIREMVNMTVDKAKAGLENRLSQINNTVNRVLAGLEDSQNSSFNIVHKQALETVENKLITTMQQLLQPIQEQLNYHLPPPPTQPPPPNNSRNHPGTSCKDLHTKYPHAPSGYYWVGESGSAVRMYCSMEETCGSETGGWMRVANIDMRNTSHTCPSGLTLLTSSGTRVCDAANTGCVSNFFSTQGVQYNRVCGKIIGHQHFAAAFFESARGIDGDYVFGVSLTHGQNPRKHIWTFAGAESEGSFTQVGFLCPCINPASATRVPSFVGNDYFCDTALTSRPSNRFILHTNDPLWDGQGCGRTNTCCSFNNPPWFSKKLPSPTTDAVEMRVCRANSDGSTPIEIVELYVQ